MGNSRKIVTNHDFYCTQCGQKGLPVCRNGRMRERIVITLGIITSKYMEINMKEMELRAENGVLLGILRSTPDGIYLEGKNGKRFGAMSVDKIIDCINQMKLLKE